MTRAAPAWLAELQARFGDAIRTPLDRSTGTLRAESERYDRTLVSVAGAAGLAVYNRQYWFRLFEVMHATFPLTTRLLGHWAFNEYASSYVLAHPPRGWDIERVGDHFLAFFATALDGHQQRDALLEASRIDRAWHDVFRAPKVTVFRPSAADAERLLDSRLVLSPAVALLEEHWPLAALRRRVLATPGEAPVALPPALERPRAFALARSSHGILDLTLEARELELLRLLYAHPLNDALGILERRVSEAERGGLPEQTRTWLARSVERGFWIGLSPTREDRSRS